MSIRALLVGLACVIALSIGAPYSIWIAGSSEITWSYFPTAVGAPFVVVVIANLAVKRLRRSWALRPGELATVVIMGLVASGVPIFQVGMLLATISAPYYGAIPNNRWEDFLQPFLPAWAIPHPGHEAMRHFYEGLPAGGRVPWGTWLGPLGWWLALLLGVYLCSLCLVVILRRQWMERERLVFPVAEVPRLLLEDEPGFTLPPVLRTGAFWVGVAVPAFLMVYNSLCWFEPGLHPIGVQQARSFELLRDVPRLNLVLYFPVVGFVYLVSTSVSFSVWFFFLCALFGTGLLSWASAGTDPDPYVYGFLSLSSWLSAGGFVAMVLLGLWLARRHLLAVARKALTGRGPDDGDEMLSYRQAALGLLGGLACVVLWLCRSGMDAGVALLFVAAALVIYLGITRLVVQSGLYYITAPTNPQAVVLALTGSAMNPYNLISLGLTYAWIGDIQSTFMPAAAHATKLNDLVRLRRGLVVPICLAVVTAFLTTAWVMLELCYEHGAVNLRSGWFQPTGGAGAMAFDPMVRLIGDPLPPDGHKLAFLLVGASAYAAVAWLRYRYLWWPLHPVGIAVASAWMLESCIASVFVGWFCRVCVLRLGGIGLFRRVRPFFIGLIVGFFLGMGWSFAVDATWFLGEGHPILHG